MSGHGVEYHSMSSEMMAMLFCDELLEKFHLVHYNSCCTICCFAIQLRQIRAIVVFI